MIENPRVIDLFSGAGGLSLGAARAGFDVAAAIELDAQAIETHTKNFPSSIHIDKDVSQLSAASLFSLANLSGGEVDGVIGGPPCQGFSLIGKRDVGDQRNELFNHFFRLVAEIQPAFFLAENVPGILDPRYDDVRSAAFAQVIQKGYSMLPPLEVRADRYGAPTLRRRIFFFGYIPNRFEKIFDISDFEPATDTELTVVSKALIGLPERIDGRWKSEEAGWRPIEKLGSGYFFDHVANAIPKGVGDKDAVARYLSDGLVSGCMGTLHSDVLKARYKKLKYGEMDSVSGSVRLDPNGYCPTLRAGTGKDKGCYQAVRPIHYSRPRVITPREAARLQGFPDWFIFHRTKWHSFRQIGNSVSPIAAEAILRVIASKLR